MRTRTRMQRIPALAARAALPVLVLAAAAADAQSNRPVVAVGALEVAVQNVSCEGWEGATVDCSQGLAAGFRAMLESAITKTGKMDVMERMQWNDILREQGLGEAGLTDAGGEIGGLTGVDYYVYGNDHEVREAAARIRLRGRRGAHQDQHGDGRGPEGHGRRHGPHRGGGFGQGDG